MENTGLKYSIEEVMKKPINGKLVPEKPDNEESLGSCILLQFAAGADMPSKQDLLNTFCRFGPLNVSLTQLLNDFGFAQVVFIRSADAATTCHYLDQNKFSFWSTLVSYNIHHLSTACPPLEKLMIPTKPNGFDETPPSLLFIKQNLQIMASILKNSGNSLPPQTRAQLDVDIKNLMRKVNYRLACPHVSKFAQNFEEKGIEIMIMVNLWEVLC
ncbi:hypothetical protein Fmac_020571 [Flemingia macrophylla]|uniref:Uncharacterized protein n=1 Tax=Flemingia macrophylla TaxID=520843 RepID=A0ABD1LUE6_9FABA